MNDKYSINIDHTLSKNLFLIHNIYRPRSKTTLIERRILFRTVLVLLATIGGIPPELKAGTLLLWKRDNVLQNVERHLAFTSAIVVYQE